MSLMDDAFDVRAVLKGKPESEAFERLMKHLWSLEDAHDKAVDALDAIRAGALIIKKLIDPQGG